ncbi:type II toxin-antitoxin system prevent-host-death family antitoxin [Frankia sp. Cppng1_Ct_nod]|uniref:type II toxin-antitoxin system Phd/YefM family antitoxin n=1 Tax=Frankia sp. Cppng1_Ct_nod TaxID=2897162 RepID=UPI0010416088|nr:type II toxin-antitoxin system prevent-host-death family antitoxin [Frankia sp. Cppng1_Ct_nod]
MSQPVSHEITQRELRNDSGAILRAVEHGETFVVTRNGSPIAELVPLRRRTFVPAAQVLAMFAHEAPLDADRFFADLDAVVDQGLFGD